MLDMTNFPPSDKMTGLQEVYINKRTNVDIDYHAWNKSDPCSKWGVQNLLCVMHGKEWYHQDCEGVDSETFYQPKSYTWYCPACSLL